MRIASKATKGKGKRWRRGTSSSCNPTNNRHRLQAKSLASTDSRPQSQQLKLTQDVISHYDSIQFQKLRLDNKQKSIGFKNLNDISDETESIGKESFATVWTNCTNVSFNKLLLGFESSSALQKQMLSLLAAITETIHSNGGQESETEYFAALMTCLESVDNEESLTAIISLLQMVMKRLPPNILRLKFSETCKVFVEYLAKYIKGENGLLVRALTDCIAICLQNQEYAVWELSSTQHIFETILSLTIHNKPRIRKTAHLAVAKILRSDVNQSKNALCHPIAKLTADFCIRKIEENGISDNISVTLYILSLLNDILPVLPNSSLKKCCETILTLMTIGNVLIVSSSFKAFYTLFAANPNEELLTPELNAKLISALYDYQPNINDSQPLCAWFAAIKEAFINLNRINKRLCVNHLPNLLNISVSCWLSDSREVHSCVANHLKQIYSECIEPSAQNIDKEIIAKIYSSLETSLKYQYCNAWFSIFNVITHSFNPLFADYTSGIINKLIVIRESYDCVYATDINHTIGRAVQVFGPKFLVNICNVKLNEENSDISHNWLLPVLRDNVKNTELSFFVDYFIPLASVLQNSCKALESEGNAVSAKTCSILISQIWSLLPSFCIKPTDFDKSFRKIAKNLGSILSDNVSLRGFVLTAIRNIAKSFDDKSVTTELSRFSKNFIPILLNIYTTEPKLDDEKNQRFSVYDIIQIFFSISENSLLLSFYSKVKEKVNDCENDSFIKHSILDLIRAFVPYLNREDINEMYTSLVIPYTKDNKHITEQKKAFRIIEAICKSDSDVCLNFMKDNLIDIINLLSDALTQCLSSSKSYALRAIELIVEKQLNNESIDWKNSFSQIIIKLLDCLLINSKKVKSAAFDLLICIFNFYKSQNDGNPTQFIELLISFFKKTEYSSTAVIRALTHLYSQIPNQIPKHTECDLVENILSNLCSNNRQTIQASIDFLKTFFRSASADQLSSYLELLITNLSNINPKHQNHFRIKVREIFVRLVRKYGYPMICKMIPESYNKVLRNIRKVEGRKRKKSGKDSDASDKESKIKKGGEIQDILADSSDDESIENEDNLSANTRKNESWIKEDMEEDNEILDLLSNKLSQNILYKNPERQKEVTKEKFAISEDGRLVIKDIDKKRGTKRSLNEEEEEVIDESIQLVDEEEKSVKRGESKRSSYQTGGVGIHRPINKDMGEEYKSDKARGDMKRKGKPDPYAYIPLNRQTLNKRKKSKFNGQFKNIVKSAQKGAQMGSRNKNKKLRKK